jgi:hypothetical protein
MGHKAPAKITEAKRDGGVVQVVEYLPEFKPQDNQKFYKRTR